jgi:peptide/nickel transport system permease protein
MIADRLPATITLAILSTTLALAISLPAGLIAALRRNTWVDQIVRLFALAGFSIPNFVLAMLMILVIGVWLRWLPISGTAKFSEDPWGWFRLYIMPTAALGAYYVAILTRFWRSSLLETLGSDYIRVAYAKGLPSRLVIWRHALKNSVIPIITIVAINFAYLLGGAVVVEQIFIIPGIGSLLIQAVIQRDFPVIQGITLVVALFFILSNLLADLLYAWADPRIGKA